MIWYLLYPFRGTTEPPILSNHHPIRLAFYRHGESAGKHWLAYILISVAVAVLVCYPVCFLYDNPASGFSKLPYHVWTSARRYHGNQSAPADVEARQIWIHGSYMKALRHDVLLNALELQNDLVGVLNEYTRGPLQEADVCKPSDEYHPSCGIHSPLIYWNCSSDHIGRDHDLLHTINSQTSRRSYLNLTLRPSSVFAGKSFLDGKLSAADALVITLFDRSVSTKSIWDERLKVLASRYSDKWAFYPASGNARSSQLYQFQFKPISIRDDIFLFFAYSLMFLYVVVHLQRTRAVKSQLGLILAIITEMAVSVFASFTICGILGIDLAVIPQEGYPFVILVIGLEHMFRLVNAVLAYPPQMAPTLRIANALGDVGHLSLAASTQNLLFLWLLHKVVSPGVQSFCTFAAVALIFDFFFHLMFFVAVLNVDVRRMELQDSIDRTEQHSQLKQRTKIQKQYWVDALIQGRTSFTTRIAGSVVSVCFILFLNVHFSDSDSIGRMLLRFIMNPIFQTSNGRQDNSPTFDSPPINSPRTPQSWLKLQDYQSAREFITYVKPQAHVLIARVYEPLVLVLRGSDRSHIPLQENTFRVFWKLAQNHIYPFFLVLISIIAIVFLLMQYLLWSEIPAEELEIPSPSKLHIKRIPSNHSLDIFKVFATHKGHILALDLDRLMVLYTLDEVKQVYNGKIVQDVNGNKPVWSNSTIKIDDSGGWILFWNQYGLIQVWSADNMSMASSIQVIFEPILVDFSKGSHCNLELIVMNAEGIINGYNPLNGSKIFELEIKSGSSFKYAILSPINGTRHVISITMGGEIFLTPIDIPGITSSSSNENIKLASRLVHDIDPRLTEMKEVDLVQKVYNIPSLAMLVMEREKHLDLVHSNTMLLIHRIDLPHEHLPYSNLRLIHSPPHACRLCQYPAVARFSMAYNPKHKRSCIIQTFARTRFADDENQMNRLICLRPNSNQMESSTCKGLSVAASSTIVVCNDGGHWAPTQSQAIIGVRRKCPNIGDFSDLHSRVGSSSEIKKAHSTSISLARTQSGLKTPGLSIRSRYGSSEKREAPQPWEVWSLDTVTGSMTTEILAAGTNLNPIFYGQDLLVVEAGPMVALGKRSVVLAMGTSLRTVTAGGDRIEVEDIDSSVKRAGSIPKLTTGSLDGRRRRILKSF